MKTRRFRINKRSLLIGLVSIATLGCLLWGLTFYSGWLESKIRTVINRQVLDDNIQTAKQLSKLIREMGIEDVRVHHESWNRLQGVVEEIKLPNEGFVCVVDNHSGLLLCHPAMRSKPELRNVPVGKCPIAANENETDILKAIENNQMKATGGVAFIKGELQVVAVAHVPQFNANVLVHQRASGIDKAIARIMTPVRSIGLVMAILVVLLVAIVNFSITKRYENQLAIINSGLEDKVAERTRALMKTRNAVIFGLAKLAESRDTDTGQHLERIRSYVTVLASCLRQRYGNLEPAYIEHLALASSLHDIGKVGIPDQILLKPGAFSPDERAVMEQHAVMGGNCLRAIQKQLGEDDFLALATEIAYFHHEKWDGTGYPARIAGTQIPLSARIVALADVYDALTSRRPYKDAMSHEKARRIIFEGRGTHFDPEVVDAFLIMDDEFRQISGASESAQTSSASPVVPLMDQVASRFAALSQ